MSEITSPDREFSVRQTMKLTLIFSLNSVNINKEHSSYITKVSDSFSSFAIN